MITHDLNHPDYNPPDCPEWAKETVADFIQPFRGRNGMFGAYRECDEPLGMAVRGIDRYQANQSIVYRPETAHYLYTDYTALKVDYQRGLLPTYEKLAAEAIGELVTDEERALALLRDGMSQIRHPSIPPCGPRPEPDRNLDDELLLASGLAWCNEQARIFVRLCQVINIPARIIQLFYADGKTGHCIAEFYAGGRWCMADASWFCVFPGPDGKLLSAAQCHDRGDGQRYCGLAYYKRQQEWLKLSDAELNIGIYWKPDEWRKRIEAETAEYLAGKMDYFAIINYPLPASVG